MAKTNQVLFVPVHGLHIDNDIGGELQIGRVTLCAKMTETNTSSFITVEGEEDMDVKSHGKQWESEPGGQ
jgi:hypothetical protein